MDLINIKIKNYQLKKLVKMLKQKNIKLKNNNIQINPCSTLR